MRRALSPPALGVVFRRLLTLLLGALVTFGAGYAAELRIGLSADVTSVDPHFHNLGPNNLVGWHVFDALTRVDENARLVPGLAESWRAVDATTWEFKLRRGVKFHDGSELTAEDVLFSIERPGTIANSPGPYTTFTRPIVAKEAVDRYTVRLKTATPYAMVPYDLNSIFIVSKKQRAARRRRTSIRDERRSAPGRFASSRSSGATASSSRGTRLIGMRSRRGTR